MGGRIAIVLSALVVIATPAVTTGNALWVLMTPALVEVEYALPGFPEDEEGLDDDERKRLAKLGIDAIRPFGEGVGVLEQARFPDGEEAFEQREIDHMQDVRDLIAAFMVAWAAALVAGALAVVWLRRRGPSGAAPRALRRGALFTLGAMALAGVVMLIDFEFFFDGFHGIFFEDETWEFNDAYTLRRIYPDFFWGAAGGALAALVAAQAGALLLGLRSRAAGRGPGF
jgi:integral membrane protein (TIGR01906 family)